MITATTEYRWKFRRLLSAEPRDASQYLLPYLPTLLFSLRICITGFLLNALAKPMMGKINSEVAS